MSNPDWPGPYWQDDASAGRRSSRDDLPQDQSPWDDAGFWRADDRRPARSDDWQSARGRARGDGQEPRGTAQPRGDADSRRAARGHAGPRGDAADGASRFSQTTDGLKNRLGIRGSVVSRDRARSAEQAADEDFWGESGRVPDGTNGDPGRRGHAAGGASRDGSATQAWQEDGSGRGGYRGSRRAGATSAGSDEDGTGQWSARTALKDRTARIQDGVRSRTAMIKGAGGGRRGDGGGGGGRGGGGGWDGEGQFGGRPLNRRQRFKRYLRSGDWWRHWTWKKALGLLGGGLAAFILLVAIGIFVIYQMTPIPTAKDDAFGSNVQSSNVYFSNGKLLGTFDSVLPNGQNIYRTILTPNQIPVVMTQAMTAAEDRGFYSEGGISVTGLLRSAYDDVFGSGGLQGGSTITMQYAKNKYTTVGTGQNITTKLKEIFIAMKLAHNRSKQWIMTQYLNVVPFGGQIDGVGAAAAAYFNVNLDQGGTLTYEQAAELAAMPNAPGVFSPNPADTSGYAALKIRYKYVLTNMLRDGNITQQQFSTGLAAFPKYNPPPSGNGLSGYTGYLMDMVRQEIEGTYHYTRLDLENKGFHIVTTFNQAKIQALIKSVNYEKSQMRQLGTSMPLYDRIGAVLENAKNGAIVAVYGGPGWNSKECLQTGCDYNNAETPKPVGSSFKPYVLAAAVNEGMNVFTSKMDAYDPIYIPIAPNSAAQHMLSLNDKQPASYPYYPLPGGGQTYLYKFDNGSSNLGPISVADAAANSSDPGFTDLAHRVGIDNVINMTQNLGVGSTPFLEPCYQYSGNNTEGMLRTCSDLSGVYSLQSQFSPTRASKAGIANGTPGSPAIALGEGQLTAIEQASTFATFADGGVYHAPHVIASLTESTSHGTKVITPAWLATTRSALSREQAADVDYALSFDNQYGTAACSVPFRSNGGVIAKTGTLGLNATTSEAWFVGSTPDQYSMAVGLFTNLPGKQVLNNLPYKCLPGSQGGAWPATIWNDFFTKEWGSQQQYQTVQQAFNPASDPAQFQTWIQAKPKPKKLGFCRPGQVKNCKPAKCHPGFAFGQPCNGGNPNPNPTCGPGSGQGPCNGNPNPNPTCSYPGQQQCTTPSPSPTGQSPSPTCTPPLPCTTPSPGVSAGLTPAKTTAARARSAPIPPLVGPEDTTEILIGSLAKLERLATLVT